MSDAFLLVLVVLAFVIVVLQLAIFRKPGTASLEQNLGQRLDLLQQALQQTGRGTGDEFSRLRQELAGQMQNLRLELSQTQKNQLDEIRGTVDSRLEQVRMTVDEKLQGTLEARLGESFKLVSDRLEQVHKGLGEMQTLASGVGDLKRVLTNVKTRGTWGEVQLGNLLEQTLTAEQYARNVATRPGSRERVEYAIRLPGQDGAHGLRVRARLDGAILGAAHLRRRDQLHRPRDLRGAGDRLDAVADCSDLAATRHLRALSPCGALRPRAA